MSSAPSRVCSTGRLPSSLSFRIAVRTENRAPILIVGRYLKSDPKDPNSEYLYHMAFEEYQPDGEMTGKIDLEYYEVESDYTFKKGTWINPNNARRLPMTQTKSVFEKASWWPGVPPTLTAPKREAYSYKYAFTKDNDGWLQDITVDLYADGKKVAPEIRESYSYPFKEDQHLDWITETDINFDGIPDLYLFTGDSRTRIRREVQDDYQPCPRQRTHVHRCLQMEERQTEQDLLQEAVALRLRSKLSSEHYIFPLFLHSDPNACMKALKNG